MKVLIVDDHPIVRAGLRRLLDDSQAEIAEAADGQEALSRFREFQPGLVVLDLHLPGISGLELLSRLKIENAKVRILVVSMHDNPAYVGRVIQAGALGYVSKNAPPEQILAAITRVSAGLSYIDHETAQELALRNVRSSGDPLQQLSPREIEILRLLAEGRSLAEIARSIGVSYKTVANLCTQLRTKLGAPRIADLIRFAISSGLSRQDISPEPIASRDTR